jgi:hypothetical protein
MSMIKINLVADSAASSLPVMLLDMSRLARDHGQGLGELGFDLHDLNRIASYHFPLWRWPRAWLSFEGWRRRRGGDPVPVPRVLESWP